MEPGKFVKTGMYILGGLAFVAGAVRGVQEAYGLVSDPTLDSLVIESSVLGSMSVGTVVGTGLFLPLAFENDDCLLARTGYLVGGATLGFTAGGVSGCTGTVLGYAAGRCIGELLKQF